MYIVFPTVNSPYLDVLYSFIIGPTKLCEETLPRQLWYLETRDPVLGNKKAYLQVVRGF